MDNPPDTSTTITTEENVKQTDDADNPQESLTRTTTKEEITQTDEITEETVTFNKRPWRQYKRIIFLLGCLMGIVLGWAFRPPDLQLEGILESVDINMAVFFDDIKAALPSALPRGIMNEARQIQDHSRESASTRAFSIGEQLSHDGISAHYPVVMVASKS